MNSAKASAPENRQETAELLSLLEQNLNTLRIEFEQFFAGAVKFQPDKLKAEVERDFRRLLRAPLKNAELNFRARSLRYRYNTLDTYWRRVLKEKEEGRYHKDLFKAGLKKSLADKEQRAKSKEGIVEKQMMDIYQVYSRCLVEAGHKNSEVSFDAFKTALAQKASMLKKRNPGKKVKFNLVIKDGLPSVEASLKE